MRKPALVGRNQDLERIDLAHVGRHRCNCDNAPAETSGCGVRTLVANNDRRFLVRGFTRQRLAKIDQTDITTQHQTKPSDVHAPTPTRIACEGGSPGVTPSD